MRRVLVVAALALSMVIVGNAPAGAATLEVGTDCPTIQACIDAAAPGDVVSIPAGTHAENVVLTKAVSLVGADAATTIVDAGGSGRALTVSGAAVDGTVTIRDLTLTGGNLTGNSCSVAFITDDCGGGLLLADTAAPVLVELIIRDNAAYRGGGLFADRGTAVDATDVDLVDNLASSDGGGAAIHDNTTWQGGTVTNNTSNFSVAGGIRLSGPDGFAGPQPTMSFDSVRFEGNDSALTAGTFSVGHGAALYVFQAFVEVSNSQFVGNTCHADDCDGGAIYSLGSFVDTTLDVDGSSFEDNTAQRNAGAIIANQRVSTTITGSSFDGNTAGTSGGAVYGVGVSIDTSTFTANQALGLNPTAFNLGQGGAVANSNQCPPITDSTFTGNRAVTGGAISCSFDTLELVDTDLIDNVAAEDGGGVLATVTGGVTVTRGTLSGNVAGDGLDPAGSNAGIGFGGAIWSQTDIDLDGTIVSGNSAIAGGGLYMQDPAGTVTINAGEISDNNATGSHPLPATPGGGIYALGDLVAQGTLFSGNTAVNDGGAGSFFGSITLDGVTVSANSAQNGGGFRAETAAITSSSFDDNVATGTGGAVVTFSFDPALGQVDIVDSSFTGNSATFGGAVSARETATVDSTTFSGNTAEHGGAIRLTGEGIITNSDFTDNHATVTNGGAISGGFDLLTIADSTLRANTAAGSGGAVGQAGNVELTGVTIDGNTAGIAGGGLSTSGSVLADANTAITANNAAGQGGGLWVNSNLTLNGTTVSGNEAGAEGGGIFTGITFLDAAVITDNQAGTDGGGLYNRFNVGLTDLIVTGNSADGDGGGLWLGRFGTVSGLTVSENDAGGAGGGIASGGAFDGTTALVITDTTVDTNTAPSGDGASFGLDRPVEITNSTFSDDEVAAPGATSLQLTNVTLHHPLGAALDRGATPVTAAGSLFVGSCPSGAGVITSTGGNVESPGDTCGLTDASDQVSVATAGVIDPALADNGGPTLTHALPFGSAAIDADHGTCPATDQRGEARSDGLCDAGAVEYTNVAPDADAGGPYTVAEGASTTLVGTGDDPDGDPVTYEWDLDGDGTPETPGATVTFSAAGLDGPDLQPVTLYVCDGNECGTDTVDVSVTNAAPIVTTLTVDPAGSHDASLLVVFTDAGVPDTHTVDVDWGDTTTSSPPVTQDPAGGGEATDTHTFAAPGLYTVTVTITDDDAASTTSTTTVLIPGLTCQGEPVTIVGTSGNDILFGTPGHDVVLALGGNDIVIGLAGHDVICGDGGRDWLIGGRGRDRIEGGDDEDLIIGGPAADILSGGAGEDHIKGNGGDDQIDGQADADVLLGNGADDQLIGGSGDDRLHGGGGYDTADGAAGHDRCRAEHEVSCES